MPTTPAAPNVTAPVGAAPPEDLLDDAAEPEAVEDPEPAPVAEAPPPAEVFPPLVPVAVAVFAVEPPAAAPVQATGVW